MQSVHTYTYKCAFESDIKSWDSTSFLFFLIFYCEICCCMPVIIWSVMFVENHYYLTNGYYVFPMYKALGIQTKIKCSSYIQGLSLKSREGGNGQKLI